jgi:hypothetical protein
MLPPAGEGARQRAALRRQLDAGVTEPLAVAPRLLVNVGLSLRPFASRRLFLQRLLKQPANRLIFSAVFPVVCAPIVIWACGRP